MINCTPIPTAQSFWSSSLGVALITGIVVFVLQRLFEKSFLDPVILFNKNLGRLKSKLSFYARLIANPINFRECNEKALQEYEKCSDELRELWADIDASYMVINRMFLFRIPVLGVVLLKLFRIPNRKRFGTAMSCMVAISNGLMAYSHDSQIYWENSNVKDLETIHEMLDIK